MLCVQLMRATMDAVKIHDLIQQQLSICRCRQKYPIQQVASGKYKVRWAASEVSEDNSILRN